MDNSNPNIIDLILGAQADEFESGEATSKKVVINASNFFTDKNPGGPITKPQWLKMVKGMAKHELLSHKALLDKLTNGEKADANPFESVDKEGRPYLWATFRYRNGNQNFKVFTAGEMCKFMTMYQMGMFSVDLSLESLYEEALK